MLLKRFLHFVNNNTIDEMDKLCKVKSVINYFNKRFKGRVSYKQFNPSKRARFRIKFYKPCESTGFLAIILKYIR